MMSKNIIAYLINGSHLNSSHMNISQSGLKVVALEVIIKPSDTNFNYVVRVTNPGSFESPEALINQAQLSVVLLRDSQDTTRLQKRLVRAKQALSQYKSQQGADSEEKLSSFLDNK